MSLHLGRTLIECKSFVFTNFSGTESPSTRFISFDFLPAILSLHISIYWSHNILLSLLVALFTLASWTVAANTPRSEQTTDQQKGFLYCLPKS